MKERLLALRPILLRVIGYPVFFGFFFLLFLYVTFPYDRLKESMVAAVEAPRVSPAGRVTPSNMELSIGKLSPTFLPGLQLDDVVITSLPTNPNDRPTRTVIERAKVHVSVFALIAQRLSLSFDVDGLGGNIEGTASVALGGTTPGLRSLHLELTDIRTGQVGPLVSAVGLPLGGTLSGEVSLELPEGQVREAEGNVSLTANRLTVGDGQAQFQIPQFGGVTIERINAGTLRAEVQIRRGLATLQRVSSHSEEFDLQMDGGINLRQNMGESALNLGVRFRLTDVYRNKSEQAGRIMSVMDMVPNLRHARRADGLFAFRCTGVLSRGTTCQPDARAGSAPTGGVTAPFAP